MKFLVTVLLNPIQCFRTKSLFCRITHALLIVVRAKPTCVNHVATRYEKEECINVFHQSYEQYEPILRTRRVYFRLDKCATSQGIESATMPRSAAPIGPPIINPITIPTTPHRYFIVSSPGDNPFYASLTPLFQVIKAPT